MATPQDPRVWIGLARARQKLQEKDKASEAAANAETLTKSNEAVVGQGLAIYHSEGGRAEEASRWADRVAPAISSYQHAALRNLLGKALFAADKADQAILELEKGVSLNPYEESYRADLGNALLRRQRFAEAVTSLEGSRKVFAASAQLELMLGVAYYAQRRFADAVDSFLTVIRLTPDLQQPHVFLNRMLPQAESRIQEVTAALEGFGKRHQDNSLGLYLRARARIVQLPPTGYPAAAAEAEKMLFRAIELSDTHGDSHLELGLLLERKREFAVAATHVERAVALRPADSIAHYRLARLYDRLGQPDKAAAERAVHDKLTAFQPTLLEAVLK